MPARIIQPTDPIEVKQLCCLIYGQPGSRKSSLAQTADEPCTLAFDDGIYRAYGRKTAALFDTWEDVVTFDLSPYKTPVVDTVGKCLAKLAQAIIRDNPKNGNRLGGLSLPGYGILKERFRSWVEGCKGAGKDLVFVAQEKAEKNGDEPYYCPDIVGGSYNTLMENCDLVGYMHFENNRRVLDFAPTDRWMAKAPPCGWPQFVLPDFGAEPHFLSGLLAQAKASMGRISEASASIVKVVEEWRSWLAGDPSLADFNARLAADLPTLENGTKRQVKFLCTEHAKAAGLTWDKKANRYVVKEGAAA